MVSVVVFLYFVLYGTIVIRSSKSEASFSSLTIFGLGAFLYYVAIPLEMSLRGLDHFVLSGEAISVTPDIQLKIASLGTMALLGFALGYHASGFNPFEATNEGPLSAPKGKGERVPTHVWLVTGTSVIWLLIFYRSELAAISTYQGHYTVSYSSPLFSLLGEFAVLGVALSASILICRDTNRRPLLGLALAAPIFAWSVYSSDKDPILIGALAVGSRFLVQSGKHYARTLAGVVLTVVLSGPSLQIFSTYRADLFLTGDALRFDGLMLDRDPTGPLVSLVETIDAKNLRFRYGTTLADSVILLVPKAIWPDRPMDLSEQFIRDRMNNSWQPGMGMGYSLLAESYLNFGWLGPLLQYGLLGLAWGYGWKLVQRNFLQVGVAYWRATYCTVAFYTLLIMHRAPSSFPVKHTLMIVLVLVLFQAFTRYLNLDMSNRPSARANAQMRPRWSADRGVTTHLSSTSTTTTHPL